MQRSRLANLRTAALVAVGFVVLRVAYRIVFGGAGGGGVLLLDLPRVPLAGPFSHIALFGPVTSGGIAAAASSAVPFAAAILAIAVLAAVIDLRALLTRGAVRGPVRTVSRALMVAWSTFPALRDSVSRVRVARELRAERSLASLIVPVLEQTIERAIALGASMEVRGFAAGRHPDPVCERPVEVRDAALGFDGRTVLEVPELRLAPGTLTLVSGATGSGKSTLLQALSGLHQHLLDGDQRGSITVAGVDRSTAPPRETAGFVGVVAQHPRLSFVAPTVEEEIGFALAIRDVAAAIVRARVVETAGELGIAHLIDRPTRALSAGEACLVAIGAAIVARPILLLVDEPLAELDAAARVRVVGVLDRLAHEARVCVVVAEHALADWAGTVDGRLELRDGVVVAGAAPPTGPDADALPAATDTPDDPVLEVRGVSVSHGDRLAVDDASLALAAGEVVALLGSNAAGKSSLLHALARPTARGTVIVGGVDVATGRRRDRRRAVALVPEAFDDLLFATTVAAECTRADRVARSRDTSATFLRLLGRDDRDAAARELFDRHPRDLSAGERLCLVIAVQLAARPAVLLIDEPSRGLDASARALVGGALIRAAAEGAAVLFATHDRGFASRYAGRALRMAAGRLDPVAPAVRS